MNWIFPVDKRGFYLIIYLLSVFLCLISVSCSEKKDKTKSESKDSTEQASQTSQKSSYQIKPTQVKTTEVKKQHLDYIIHTNGKVVASQQAALSFLVSGKINKLYAQNGAYIKEGQTIASLENSEAILRFKRAKEEKAIRYDEYRKLFIDFGGELGDITSISDTLNQILKTRSGLALAQIQEEEAAQALENTILKAPFSGRLSNFFVSKGAFVSASSPVCMLHSSEALEVEAFVPESEVFMLEKGNKADILPISSSSIKFESTLIDINPQVENEGLVKLRFKINPNQKGDENLLLNMNVTVTLYIPQQEQLVIPKEAIVLRSEKEVVFSYQNERAFWNFVKTGKENGKEIEILEGLKEGQQIIISNNLQLSHDAEVEVLK